MKYDYDAIIIGSGIGGLACGAMLAKNGYKVKIFERLHQPGGYVNTFERKAKNGNVYRFEGSTHQIGGFNNPDYLKPDLDELGIKLDFIELEHCFESVIFDKNYDIKKRYKVESGEENAYKSLINYFPEEKENLKKIFNICKNISLETLEIRKLKKSNKAIDINAFHYFNKYKEKNYNDLLMCIDDKDLKFILSQYCYYFFASKPKKLSAIFMSNVIYNFILSKPLFIKNGTQTLVNECIKIIKKYNGEIEYNSNVNEIIIENGVSVGIKLSNNDNIYSKCVVSDLDAYTTFRELIKNYRIDEEFNNKLNYYKPSKSAFQIFLGLPFDIKEYGFNYSTIFFSNCNNIEEIYNENGLNPELDCFLFSNYSIMDNSFSDINKSSVLITQYENSFDFWNNLDDSYIQQKKIKQEKIINKIEKIFKIPISKYDICFSSTPKTMFHYSGKKNGAAFGAERSNSKYSKYENKTIVNNLFMVSSDTSLGGILGTFDSALNASNIISKNIRIQ